MFIFRAAKDKDLVACAAFYSAQAAKYLWPRDLAYLEERAADNGLWVVLDDTKVVGACYVSTAEHEPNTGLARAEFGGVLLLEQYRGRDLAMALGRLAITSLWINDPPRLLIAHVHEDNQLPRGLLTKRLGFRATDQHETPPSDKVPESMPRNRNGDVVGDVFEFEPRRLAEFAAWFQSSAFDGFLFEEAMFSRRLLDTIAALIDIAAQAPASKALPQVLSDVAPQRD